MKKARHRVYIVKQTNLHHRIPYYPKSDTYYIILYLTEPTHLKKTEYRIKKKENKKTRKPNR